MLEIATKKYPYYECTNQAQIYKKVVGGIKPAALEEVTDESVKAFIELCIKFDPKERPSAEELLKHPFLIFQQTATTHDLFENPSNMMNQIGESGTSLGGGEDAKAIQEFDSNAGVKRAVSQSQDSTPSPQSTTERRSKSTTSSNLTETQANQPHNLPQSKGKELSDPKSMVVETQQHHFQISKKGEIENSVKVASCVIEVVQVLEDEVTLSMQYRSGKNSIQIRFPFHLATDTATDVVTELVKEKLIFEEDDQIIRRKIEEVIRGTLIKQRDAGSEKSFDQKRPSSDVAPPLSSPYTSNHSSFELAKGANAKEEFQMREIETAKSEPAFIGSASDLVVDIKPLTITKAVTSPAFDTNGDHDEKPNFITMHSASNFEIPRSTSPDKILPIIPGEKTGEKLVNKQTTSKKSEDIDQKLRQLQEQNLQLFNDFSKTKADQVPTKRSLSPSFEATLSTHSQSTPSSAGAITSTESTKFPSHSVPVESTSPRSLSPTNEYKSAQNGPNSSSIPSQTKVPASFSQANQIPATPAKPSPEKAHLLQSPLIPEPYNFKQTEDSSNNDDLL